MTNGGGLLVLVHNRNSPPWNDTPVTSFDISTDSEMHWLKVSETFQWLLYLPSTINENTNYDRRNQPVRICRVHPRYCHYAWNWHGSAEQLLSSLSSPSTSVQFHHPVLMLIQPCLVVEFDATNHQSVSQLVHLVGRYSRCGVSLYHTVPHQTCTNHHFFAPAANPPEAKRNSVEICVKKFLLGQARGAAWHCQEGVDVDLLCQQKWVWLATSSSWSCKYMQIMHDPCSPTERRSVRDMGT